MVVCGEISGKGEEKGREREIAGKMLTARFPGCPHQNGECVWFATFN